MSTTQRIHLQSIGQAPAKPASEFVPGDRIMFNFGYVYTVTAIETAKMTTVTATDDRTGLSHTWRKRPGTLMGMASVKEHNPFDSLVDLEGGEDIEGTESQWWEES